MEGGEFRCWDELIPDALGLIFCNLSLKEILTVIPRVCKSWGKAVAGPYCWQEIDIEEWSKKATAEELDRMLKMLFTRSCGSVRKLCISYLPNDSFLSFIANHAGSLQMLRLPGSDISDSIVQQEVGRFSSLTFLDLTYCNKIGAPSLEAIGKHCKQLSGLKRVMHPLEVADKESMDDEAHAIATTMPKLKHLEIGYLVVTTEGVLEILSNCKNLEFLDVRGCFEVKLDEKFLMENFSRLKVLGPDVANNEKDFWDDCSYYSDSSGYLAWDFVAGEIGDYDDESSDEVWDDDEQRLEELEMRFYEGLTEAVEFAWPQFH